MEYYDKFVAIAEKFGMSGKEMKDYVEMRVKEAKEEDRNERAEKRDFEKLKHDKEQLKNDNLKMQLELQQGGEGIESSSQAKQKEYIKVRQYDQGKEKIDTYLDYFESVMTLKKCKEDDWPGQLMTKLSGEAFEAFNSVENKANYQDIKKSLLLHFGKSENDYRKDFHDMRIKQDRDPQMTVHDTYLKLTKWLELT